MKKPIRFRWPFGQRGCGIRKDSCYIEPIDVFCTLTAKHCGDHTADCSNGVLIGEDNVDIKIFGNKNPSGRGQGGVIFDQDGICGALNVANSTPPNIAVRAVLTPDREEKRQNGRRMKNDGEPMFTLTAQDRHGVAVGGYNDVNANERNTCEILRLLRKEIGEKAFAEWGIAITTSFQQAEVLQQGVHEKSIFENREKQSNIQQCSHNSEIDKQVDYERNCLPKMWLYEKFRCSPSGRRLYEQFREQFDCAMQKLSHENPSPQEFMCALWQAGKGIGVLREALSEIQEIRRCVDMQWQKGVRIRRLTPREVWRLQGFPDEYFDRAKAAGVSDSQLYKQAGNSVSVPVAKAIGLRLKEIEQCEDINSLTTTD